MCGSFALESEGAATCVFCVAVHFVEVFFVSDIWVSFAKMWGSFALESEGAATYVFCVEVYFVDVAFVAIFGSLLQKCGALLPWNQKARQHVCFVERCTLLTSLL